MEEKRWQQFWEQEKIYQFSIKSKKKIYSIDTPPPTISGEIHMGHAFSYSHLDFIARFRRMQGYNVFYPFGFDNNGLPTERLVEKERNVKANQMERKKFNQLCLEVSHDYEKKFKEFWGRLGLSVDWSLLYSTIEKRAQKISQYSFIDLHKKGRIYQKKAPILWCPECETAIAQVELRDEEKESTFVDIVFKLENKKDLVIATTRPELLPSCVAVFVHPQDRRYRQLVGKKVQVPLFGHWVPIMADSKVDMGKGSGAVMCCLFGDLVDAEWYLTYNFHLRIAFTKNGKMTELAKEYQGLKIKEARKQIIADLKEKKLLLKETPIKHAVNVHERCGIEIEILETKQWFLKYLDLKEKFLELGKQLHWYPSHMKHRYDNWVKGLKWDWTLSRQRYFGVPFPVWYCKKCEKVMLAEETDLPVDPLVDNPKKKCSCGSNEFIPEQDVMDTWATSSLTPEINAKWLENKIFFNKIFPMSLRASAHDIITLWQFNTVVKSYLHFGKLPWKDVMISGWGLDAHGKKMSKSKGNIISPVDLLERYPADAIRFWAAGSSLGEDTPFLEKDVITGKKTITKLLNASSFTFQHLKDFDGKKPSLEVMDRWIMSSLQHLVQSNTKAFTLYEYSKVRLDTEKFFWYFCDYYLEIVKDRLYNPEKRGNKGKKSAQYTLYYTLLALMKMFAPIMPYITEEIYQEYYRKREKEKSIHLSEWPSFKKEFVDKKAETIGALFVEILTKVRQFKSRENKSMKQEIILTLEKKDMINLKECLADLQAVTQAKEIKEGAFDIKLL